MKVFVTDLLPTAIQILQHACEPQGFMLEVIGSNEALLAKIDESPRSVLLYDASLISAEKAEFYEKVRQVKRVPMLVLVPKASTIKTEGEVYEVITKPFVAERVIEQLANIFLQLDKQAQLEYKKATHVQIGALSINRDMYEVKYQNQLIYLSSKEFATLFLLVQHANQPVSREQIYQVVWDEVKPPSSWRVVDYQLKGLRKKINHLDKRFQIKACYRKGYEFTLFSD